MNTRNARRSLREADACELVIIHKCRTLAKKVFRCVKDAATRDDLIQESIAQGWKAWRSCEARGKSLKGIACGIANRAVQHVRDGRAVAGNADYEDALSPRAARIHRFACLFDVLSHDGSEANDIATSLVSSLADPADVAALRVDLPMFLATRDYLDNAIVHLVGQGDSLPIVAEKLGLHRHSVWKRQVAMRASWEAFTA